MTDIIEKKGMLDGRQFYDKSQFDCGSLYAAKLLGTWAVYLCEEYISHGVINKGFYLVHSERTGLEKGPVIISRFDEIRLITDLKQYCSE